MKSFTKFTEADVITEQAVAALPTLVILKKHSVTAQGDVLYELKAPAAMAQRSNSRVVVNPNVDVKQH